MVIHYITPLDILGITVNVSKHYSKGISHKLFGPKFASNAIEVAFHSQDHALSAISQSSISLNRGTVNKLKLQKTKIDRKSLFFPASYQQMEKENDEVKRCIVDGLFGDISADFGWPAWSKNNCEYYADSLYISTCSLLQSVGIPPLYFGIEDKYSMKSPKLSK